MAKRRKWSRNADCVCRRRKRRRWRRPEIRRTLSEASTTDPFDEIDFGSFFDDYLDPGYRSPASESVEKPSFETFLSQPQTLPDYLRSQLSVSLLDDETRDAAESIIGNLDEDGYLTATLDEMAQQGEHYARGDGSGAEGGAVARSGGRGRARSEGVPAAADRKHERQRRRGLADRFELHAAARNAAVQGTGEGCWAGRRSISISRWR